MLAATRYRWVLTLLVVLLVVFPVAAFAQLSQIVPASCDGPNCTICDLADLAQNLLNVGIYVLVAMSAVLFAYAGWIYTTAGGNPGSVKKAHDIFLYVFIGLLLVVGAWLVVDTLMKTLTGGKLGPWNKVCEFNPNLTGSIF